MSPALFAHDLATGPLLFHTLLRLGEQAGVANGGGRIELRSREEVEQFLEEKPREWAEILAARTALRVLPLLGSLFAQPQRKQAGRKPDDILLSLLRGAVLPWLVALVPSSRQDLREAAHAAARSTARAAAAAYTADAYAPARAAAAAAEGDAAYAVYAAATAATANAAVFEAFSSDASRLAGFGQADILRSMPLWSGFDALGIIAAGWRELTAALSRRDGAADWRMVWIDWYESIRDGREPWSLPSEIGERIMVEAMLWSQEEWDRGAVHINRRLAGLITAELEKSLPTDDQIPQQESFAHRFNGLDSEPIDIAKTDDASDRLRAGYDRQEDYADIRIKAHDLEALGPNRLGDLANSLERLLALPSSITETRAQSFWSVANTLRIKLSGHEAASVHDQAHRERQDYENDERLLEALVGDGLKDLVETINAFVLGDPALMDRDAARPGPQETQLARLEAQLIAPVVAAVDHEPDVATEEASQTVVEELAKTGTRGASLPERQGAEAGRRSIRNFVAALLRRAYVPIKKAGTGAAAEAAFAWKEMRSGFYKKAGEAMGLAGVVGGAAWLTGRWATIAEFVAHHAATLSAYAVSAFPNNPYVVRIIETIAKLFAP